MIYDVVVVGGGTAGCAAAYIAGKLGLKTLLIETIFKISIFVIIYIILLQFKIKFFKNIKERF